MPVVTFTRPQLYPEQEAAVYSPARLSLIEATTKAGKTVGCLIWLLEQALRDGTPSRNYWWVAPVISQSQIAYRRLRRMIPQQLRVCNDTERTITLANGATIWFKGAEKPDNLYGEDVWAAVIDEASRVREQSWHAVRSTVTATRGPVRIIGNVKGRRNWFYALARRAEAGQQGYSFHRITAVDAVRAGILDQEEVDSARQDLPEYVFKQLYEAIPADDEGNPFGGPDVIGACVAPLSGRSPLVWGWDLAKSVDWTVGIALDAERHTTVIDRFQQSWEETTDRIAQLTARTPALVDSTGVGDPILERLQKGRPNYEGFKFSSTSKQQLMEGLAMAISRREVHYPEGVVTMELDAFEYQWTRTGVRYSAPEGMHDDAVCALALAVSHHAVAARQAESIAAVW